MPTATVTSKGQITIPKEIRDQLGLKPGDRVRFETGPDGQVSLQAKTLTLADLGRILPRPRRALTLEEMDQAIGQALAERHLRAK